MKINITQLQHAIINYFNQEILTKIVGWKKFATDVVFNLYVAQLPDTIVRLSTNPLIKATQLIDENQFIDVDTLYTHAKNAIQKSGQFELFGVIFNESDIDKLYSMMKIN
jgi:hypothetical protein